MAKTVKQAAMEYVSPETKNIAELKKVSVDIEIEEKTYTNKDGEEFTINVTNIDGEDYRIPNSVLKQLKVLIEHTPKMKNFSVIKSGEGLKTTYQVVPAQ